MSVQWLDVEQRSDEWHQRKLGLPSASQMHRVITPTGKPSAASGKYLGELLAEWATGQAREFKGNGWVQRGIELEDMARAWLEFRLAVPVTNGGMYIRNANVGASPDGHVGVNLAEVKVPAPWTHLAWLAEGGLPRDHIVQVQSQLWVSQADSCEFLSLCPDIVGAEAHHVTVEPDEALQEALDKQVPLFCERLRAAKERLLEMGVEPA